MKNKKGMTLVEIILTIALLAVLGIIISINAVGMLNREKDKTKTEQNERIIDACVTYCNLSSHKSNCPASTSATKDITVTTLYNDGLIDDDDYTDELKGKTLTAKYVNNELTCVFK